MYNYMWLGLGALLSALPVVCIKKYMNCNNINWIILAVLMNSILIYVYYNVFLNHTCGTMYTIIKILSILMVISVGYIIYNEKLNNYNILGIVLSIITIYLLSKKE